MKTKSAVADRYVIGVDLGTTNTVAAYVDLSRAKAERRVEYFEVPQLVAPGELGQSATLPSFLYLAGPHDLPEGSLALPWDAERGYAVGALAREQGARQPGRVVSSAKSWLSHGGVERTADLLPWRAPGGVDKVSPVEASARYLQHLREAWNERMAEGDGGALFERQLVVLTVPASFDEVARELTVDAAKQAGIPRVVLLEEPLAAFYAWIDGHAAELQAMQDGQLVLVCDVGGGTTDLSIIGVRRDEEGVRFDRLAVGEHLMLGGDNMDHALGRRVEADAAGGAGKLEPLRWHQLVHQCRRAKEVLLGENAPDREKVAVPARGSGLVSGTITATLYRSDAERLVVDGFFPETALDAPLQESRRSGLTELGLPYETDPAITRHLAAFWRRFQALLEQETGREAPRPDFLLFNGGVFTPALLRNRVQRIIGGWFGAGSGWQPEELAGAELYRAVAHGAAYYGLVRLGERARVGSGSARGYYVGIGSVDGSSEEAQRAVCLVPRGAEEGFEGHLHELSVQALTNQPVTFHLLSSTTRTGDRFGQVVELAGEAQRLPPIRTVLQFGKKGMARAIPVEIGVRLTEIGTLELWCESRETEHRWALHFDVRQEETEEAAPVVVLDPAKIEAAKQALREVFEGGRPPGQVLWEQLETVLEEPREAWTIPLLRTLADTLLNLPRDRSALHEVLWFDLLGYALRPGYGDDVDPWRMQEVWKRYLQGLRFTGTDNRLAWWLFWRRVGSVLPADKQARFYYDVRPYVQLKTKTEKRHPLYPYRFDDREKVEAWKTLATFERLPAAQRAALGRTVVEYLQRKPSGGALWALSRLGTRQPLYGPLDGLVAAEEAGSWLKALLAANLPKSESAAYTFLFLARRTGHRGRDVSDSVRQQVVGRLRRLTDADSVLAPLEDAASQIPGEAQAWLLGESMPPAGTAAAPDQLGITYGGGATQPSKSADTSNLDVTRRGIGS